MADKPTKPTKATKPKATKPAAPKRAAKTKREHKTKIGKFEKAAPRIVDAVRRGNSYRMACNIAGLHESTFYTWMKEGQADPDSKFGKFRVDVLAAESENGDRLLGLIQEHAIKDWKAAAWVLERRHSFIKDGRIETEQIEKVELPTDTYQLLRQQATDLNDAINRAQAAESWQAYAALQRQMLNVVQQIRQIEAESDMHDELGGFTDEQLITEITNAIITLPPLLRQRLEQQVTELANVVPLQGAKA